MRSPGQYHRKGQVLPSFITGVTHYDALIPGTNTGWLSAMATFQRMSYSFGYILALGMD